jgi:hypothetical protein
MMLFTLAASLLALHTQLSNPILVPDRFPGQVPIHPYKYGTLASASGPGWIVREQDKYTCDAGSRHFAGRINITDTKSIFFCKYLSREGYRYAVFVLQWHCND